MKIKHTKRKILATPKITAAKTNYYDLDETDENYVYYWLHRLLADITEAATYNEDLRRDWFKRRPGVYPKGENGPNSHASVLGGIVSAKLQNPKKNLSEAQLDIVENLFEMIEELYSTEDNPPTAVVFERSLFRSQ